MIKGKWRTYVIEDNIKTDKTHTDFTFLDNDVIIDAVFWGWSRRGKYECIEERKDGITTGTIKFYDFSPEYTGLFIDIKPWTFDFKLENNVLKFTSRSKQDLFSFGCDCVKVGN